MSYKLALCDVPAGGARCVVIGDPRTDKTDGLLQALGQVVERMGGRYIIGEDVGLTAAEIQVVATQTRFVVGKRADAALATAHGVYVGLQAAVMPRLRRSRLAGVRVAVQGLGSVGRRLCRLLAEAGANPVVADLDERSVARVVAETGATEISVDAIYDQEVDVFAPCAPGAVLEGTTVPRLKCTIVAGSANNQLADARYAAELASRAILLLPDFVLNAGGVIAASYEADDSIDDHRVLKETERVAELLRATLQLAERDVVTPCAAAVRLAKQKLRARHEP